MDSITIRRGRPDHINITHIQTGLWLDQAILRICPSLTRAFDEEGFGARGSGGGHDGESAEREEEGDKVGTKPQFPFPFIVATHISAFSCEKFEVKEKQHDRKDWGKKYDQIDLVVPIAKFFFRE